MAKYNYNGEEIEIPDKLEKGFIELDLITDDDEHDELEDTIGLDMDELANIQELAYDGLSETKDLTESLGNINEQI